MKVRVLISQEVDEPDIGNLDFLDRTSILIEQEWEISQQVGSMIDSLVLELDDPNANITILEGRDVIIEDFTNPSIRHYGGIITSVRHIRVGVGRILRLECQDYTMLADRSTVRKTYDTAGQTDKSIIQDAIAEAGLTEINTDNVQSSRTIDRMNFQGASIRSLLDTLAEISGATWRIDYFKKLFYHPKAFNSLTFAFSDAPDDVATFPYYNFNLVKELAEWNALELQGGKDVSDDITDIYSNDGVETIFITGQQAGTNPIDRAQLGQSIIVIEENTNTNASPTWTARTVTHEADDPVLGVDTDIIWNPGNGRIQWNSAPPNFATNSFRVSGRYLIDIIIIVQDTDAIAKHGRAFTGSLIIPETRTIEEAQDLALAWLREHSDKIRVTFDANKDDIEVNRQTKITNALHGFTSEDIFIYRNTIRLLGAETAEYHVEADVINFNLFR